jgi:hypothetical protein
MFLILGMVLLFGWLFGFVVMHVSSFLIHLLIVAAVVSFIAHFILGHRHAGSVP